MQQVGIVLGIVGRFVLEVVDAAHTLLPGWARVAGDDEEMQRFVPIEDLFEGRHFDGQIIILCVAWYTSFKLSLPDLVIMMADRGISVTHTTILRWVQRYLTFQNSKSAGGATLGPWADRGGWTRPI